PVALAYYFEECNVGRSVDVTARPLAGLFLFTSFTQERINGAQQGVLVALGQLVNLVDPAQDPAVLQRAVLLHRFQAQQLIGGNAQGVGKADDHLGVEVKIIWAGIFT
ncbi:MAG: hypothetical protein QME74_11945, partial [Candidatus Edwardsbacteria bacterium]|nr:hypothetical protein [Candidatus Edwardsbacteria bacterium]